MNSLPVGLTPGISKTSNRWKNNSKAVDMMRSKSRRAVQLALGLLAAAVVLVGAAPAFASGVNAGPAVLTDPQYGTPLNQGGSATNWALRLPGDAACSFDSTHNYHVFSYIIPSSIDPATLTFDSSGPHGPSPYVYPLYDVNFNQYGPVDTAPGTGRIINLPQFNFSAFAIDGSHGYGVNVLPTGTYLVGIACADGAGKTDNFWNAQVTFSQSSTDINGEIWSTLANDCSQLLEDCAVVFPATNLQDGQVVTVYFSNIFPPQGNVYIQECTPKGQTPVQCSPFGVVMTTGDGGGTGSAKYIIHTLPNPAQPSDITCDSAHPCSISAANSPGTGRPSGLTYDQPTITFAPGPPKMVPETRWAVLLPLSMLGLGGAIYLFRRRRRVPAR